MNGRDYYNFGTWTASFGDYFPAQVDITTAPITIDGLPQGTYGLQAVFEADYSVYSFRHPPIPTAQISIVMEPTVANAKPDVVTKERSTKLFANGLAVVESSSEYFSIIGGLDSTKDMITAKGRMKFLSDNGQYGLRMTNEGVLVTDNGTDAVPNWYGLMPGLVYAGRVSLYGHELRLWSAPGLGMWASRQIGPGHYVIDFDRPFTTADDYTVLTEGTFGYASVTERSTGWFTLRTADDAAENDAEFSFFVLNTKKWTVPQPKP